MPKADSDKLSVGLILLLSSFFPQIINFVSKGLFFIAQPSKEKNVLNEFLAKDSLIKYSLFFIISTGF